MEHTPLARPTASAEVRPFVDYYAAHDISPVAQDIGNLGRHFERRSSLYRSLGVPPLYVRGSSVLEFGPGSGHNALYTQHLAPARYLLVDANPRGLSETASLLAKTYPAAQNYEIRNSLIEEFESPETFDLVIAEGLVPFQMDPADFIRRIARFVATDGVLIFTTVDGSSLMGEIGRRLIASRLTDRSKPDAERVKLLAPVFAPHLATLAGMTRSVDDWIYDNVLIPFVGKTFAIDEAIETLGAEFDIYGSSPEFVVDMRWYKQLYGRGREFNARASRAYLENVLNFLDYRITVPAHEPELGSEINALCRDLYARMQDIEASDGARTAVEAAPSIRRLAAIVSASPRTSAAFTELAAFLEAESVDVSTASLEEFASYFGRGMQYLSFIRRA
jgi:SAM-dependent methyltransferase